MSQTYISADLRRLAMSRSDGACEYCLIAEVDTFLGCSIDHVISEKHGGATVAENLAVACVFCNQAKGSDIASIDWLTGTLVRLFNPRTDCWSEHFEIHADMIQGITPVGRVTAALLKLNSLERRMERSALIEAGHFPRTMGGDRT